jgi:hypothetical protein
MAAAIRQETERPPEAPPEGTPVGLLAEFEHPLALMEAVKRVREAGYVYFDTHTPFPIHGMD